MFYSEKIASFSAEYSRDCLDRYGERGHRQPLLPPTRPLTGSCISTAYNQSLLTACTTSPQIQLVMLPYAQSKSISGSVRAMWPLAFLLQLGRTASFRRPRLRVWPLPVGMRGGRLVKKFLQCSKVSIVSELPGRALSVAE